MSGYVVLIALVAVGYLWIYLQEMALVRIGCCHSCYSCANCCAATASCCGGKSWLLQWLLLPICIAIVPLLVAQDCSEVHSLWRKAQVDRSHLPHALKAIALAIGDILLFKHFVTRWNALRAGATVSFFIEGHHHLTPKRAAVRRAHATPAAPTLLGASSASYHHHNDSMWEVV